MSFNVSNSFNPYETIGVTTVCAMFQFSLRQMLKAAANCPPIASCFKVSVVSLLIDFLFEIQKVFCGAARACVCIVIAEQDYTWQLPDRSMQRYYGI